jgi:hypothetical protein
MLQEGDTITIEMDEDRMIEVEVKLTYLGCPPSWEWDGGHPGDPMEFKIKEIRLHPDEVEELPEDPGPMSKMDALVLLGYTVEEFDNRLQQEVESTVEYSCIPDHDHVYNEQGYRI